MGRPEDDANYHLSIHSKKTDLSKLFCFWKPIQSSRGKVISLLISAKTEDTDPIYRETLRQITEAMEGSDLHSADPINIDAMEFESLSNLFNYGKKLSHSVLSYVVRMLAALFMWSLCGSVTRFHKKSSKLRSFLGNFHADSNYCQLDQTLAMVLGCTHAESDAIEKICKHLNE